MKMMRRVSLAALAVVGFGLLATAGSLRGQEQKDVWKTPDDKVPVGTANADDLVWQKAVAKYDGARAKLDASVAKEDAKGPFAPNWPSLQGYKIPEWYQDAKFGIFIHYGAYSVEEFGSEWYPRNMYLENKKDYEHEVKAHGPETQFGYKDLIPGLTASKFSAKQWADLFKEAGARYVIPVAEHHDGFAMYNSSLSDWDAVKMGPKQDYIGELRTAVLADGLHFGASSHRAEHYFFLNGGRAHPSDVQDPKYAALYGPAHVGPDPEGKQVGHPDPAYLNDWLARSAEIVEKYHPELIYFDWWVEQPEFQPYLKKFAAFYYNQAAANGQQVVLFRKNDAFAPGSTVLDIERGQEDKIQPDHWQTDTPIANQSWGYISDDTYKAPETILWQLIDIVSKNGNLLLDVGPKPDGEIPEQSVAVLKALGGWLKVNGEAIYGTRAWKQFGEGPTGVVAGSFNDSKLKPYTAEDFRFTTHGDTLYAIAMNWAGDGKYTIKALGTDSGVKVAKLELLGATSGVTWKQTSDGLEINVAAGDKGTGLPAYAFRITQ